MRVAAARLNGRKRVRGMRAGVSALVLGAAVYASAWAADIDNGATIKVPEDRPGGWDMGNASLSIGGSGEGRLEVTAGGRVHNIGFTHIAFGLTGWGVLSVSGVDAKLETNRDINVGINGDGELHIGAGGLVTAGWHGQIGNSPQGAGWAAVSGANARWISDDYLAVGVEGTGTLVINQGGVVTAGNDASKRSIVYVAQSAGSRGTLVIGDLATEGAAAAGTLDAKSLIFGEGDGTLVFNHTGMPDGSDLVFAPDISGVGNILHKNGITILTGNNTYGGNTAIDGGTLALASGSTLSSTSSFNLSGANAVLDIRSDGTEQAHTIGALSGVAGSRVMLGANSRLTTDSATDAMFIGVISGSGSLVKEGSGSLILDGINTYAGGTTVQAGSLIVGSSGGSTASVGDVRVNSGAMLGGHGTVGRTSIAAGGILAPGNSIGTLKIGGDLTFAGGSFYRVEVDPANNDSDLVKVAGTATLGGSVEHIGLGGDYRPLSTYRILTAGAISGEFDGVRSDYAFLTPELSYETLPDMTQAVDLTLARNVIGFADMGRSRNQIATAQGVASLGSGAVHDAVLSMPDNPALIQRGYDALSGEVHASAQSTLIAGSHIVRDASNNRLRAAFSGVGSGYSPIRVASAGSLAGVVTPRTGLGVWATSFGSWRRQEGDSNAATLRQDTAGFLLGADRPVSDWRIGMLAGYSHSSFDVDDRASSGKGDSYHLGLYGGRQRGALGLRAGLNHTWHELDTRRSVAVGGLSERLKTSYRARTMQAYGEVGYRIDTDVVSLEPYANLAHVRLHTLGYTEQGGVAALSGEGRAMDMTYSTLGVRVSRDFTLGWGDASVYGTLGWRRELSNARPSVTHAFAGGESFTVTGTPIARDAAVIKAGLDVRISDTAVLGVSYSGQLASGARDHGVNASLRVAF